MHVTSDLAAGLQISFEDAERLKRAFPDLLRKKETQQTIDESEVDARTALERSSKVEKKSDSSSKRKKKSDDIMVSSIGVSSVDTVSESFCKDIINARITEIMTLVKDQIEKSGVPLTIPAGVVVTGGGAKTYGIVDTVKKSFGVTCRVGKPTGLQGMVDEISDTEFSVVQGLIKYAIVEDVDVGGGRGIGGPTSSIIEKLKDWLSNILPKSN